MRIYSFKDLEKRFPDLFNRIKGYVLLAGVLKSFNERALDSHVKLRAFFRKILEEKVTLNSLNSITPLPREIQQNVLLQANPELFETEITITFDKEMFTFLAKLLWMLFQVATALTNNLRNLLQNTGVDIDMIRQAVAQASNRLAQNAVNKVVNPEADVPSFEDIIRNELVDQLQLNEILANKLLNMSSILSADECRPSAPSFKFFCSEKEKDEVYFGFSRLSVAKVIAPFQDGAVAI